MRNAIRNTAAALAVALLAIPVGTIADGDEGKNEAKEHDELSRAMRAAKVPLERGVSTAAAKEGTPISAKYEVEDGKLQLSVYTMKGDKFSEVIVDHGTGKVAKSEPIRSGDDLKAAQEQKQAMAHAKRSLAAATSAATKENPGYRAVSAMPRMDEGHPVATVTLLKGDDWKTVFERLDSAR
jgi:uncharacterized membrane protein YkoI